MTSKQPVQTTSAAAVIATPPAIKDSPAVERALNRRQALSPRLLESSVSGRRRISRLCAVRRIRRRRAGRARCLETSLDGMGGERAKQKIALMRKQLDHIEKLVASECVNWQLSDLQAEHRRVFSNVITLDCPPYETLFGNDQSLRSPRHGDIAGFYNAFGVELSKDIHERLDHLSVEFEFMHFLAYKESYSRCHDGADKTQIVVDAQKKFVKNHVGRGCRCFAGCS